MLPSFSNRGTYEHVFFAIKESRRKSLNVWATSPLCTSHAEQYETISFAVFAVVYRIWWLAIS
jgi:hypothetical protein